MLLDDIILISTNSPSFYTFCVVFAIFNNALRDRDSCVVTERMSANRGVQVILAFLRRCHFLSLYHRFTLISVQCIYQYI